MIQSTLNLVTYDTIQVGFTNLVSKAHWGALSNQLSCYGKIETANSSFVGGKKVMVYSFADIRGAFSAFQNLAVTGLIEGAELSVSFVDKTTKCEKPITEEVFMPLVSFASSYAFSLSAVPEINYNVSQQNMPFGGVSLMEKGDTYDDYLKHGSLDMNQDFIPAGSYASASSPFRQVEKSINNFGPITKANVSKNNMIDLKRIAKGLDTRTTVMLRNIPNKVDQQMLKDYLDVTNKHTYDFLCKYIRAVT